jgi:FkbM family methyltransferase
MTASCQSAHALDDLLAELRSESAAQTAARVREAWRAVAGAAPFHMVIFGCGQLGRFVLPAVRAAGLEPLAYCDNNPRTWGTEIDGVRVLSPADAAQRWGASAPFLTAVYNSGSIRHQLRELGCRWVVPYPAFFWEHAACLPAEERLALPQHLAEHVGEIQAVYALLADDRSRHEFLAQIRWRWLLDYACLPPHDRPADMYFPPDLMALSADEVLVDCGAFDGDSIRLFLEKTGGKFQRIHAFEPDPGNICALTRYLSALPPEIASRIDVEPCAVGRENGIVRFQAEGSAGSKLSGAGEVEIPCRTLDSALPGVIPTIVKMDIEGAEIDAIPGAARISAECRPILAVCAYHRCQDLWTLPGLLQAANPEYRIFLRRYAEECWETVYYAIPMERLAPAQN